MLKTAAALQAGVSTGPYNYYVSTRRCIAGPRFRFDPPDWIQGAPRLILLGSSRKRGGPSTQMCILSEDTDIFGINICISTSSHLSPRRNTSIYTQWCAWYLKDLYFRFLINLVDISDIGRLFAVFAHRLSRSSMVFFQFKLQPETHLLSFSRSPNTAVSIVRFAFLT
jgi:hypothetical protein